MNMEQRESCLVENDSVITRSVYDEVVRLSIRRWYRVLLLTCGVLLIVCGAALFWLSVLNGRSGLHRFQAVLFFILGVFFVVWVNVLMPRVVAARGYRQMQMLRGQEQPHQVVRFYPDRLEVLSDNGGCTTLPYLAYRRWKRGQQVLLLIFDNNVGVILRLDSFVRGGEGDVYRLLGR